MCVARGMWDVSARPSAMRAQVGSAVHAERAAAYESDGT